MIKQLLVRPPGALARNSFRFLTWQILRAGCLAAYLLLLTRILGATTYGALSGPLSLAAIFGTLSGGGAGLMLLRDTAKDSSDLALAWSRMWSAIMISTPICVTLYVVLTKILFGSTFPLRILLVLAASEIILLPVVAVVALAFQARERLGTAGAIMTLPALGRLIAVMLLAVAAPTQPLTTYLALHLGATAVVAGIAVALLMTRTPLTWRVTVLPLGWWRDCLGLSTMYFVTSAAVDLDKSLVLRNGTAEMAGHYNLGYRLAMILTLPVQALAQAALPRAVRQLEDRSREVIRLVVSLGVVTFLYSFFASITLWLCGATIIGWFGPGFSEVVTMIPAFCALLTLYNLRLIPCVILQAAGQPLRRAGIEAIALVLLCALSAILVPRYGLPGALMTAIASEFWIFAVALIAAARTILSHSRIK